MKLNAASGRKNGWLPRRALQALDQLVELQLLEALADRVQLARRVLEQLAPLSAQVERFAQTGLAGVEPLDDLLESLHRGLVGRWFSAHSSTSSRTRAGTWPSAMRNSKSEASRMAAALASGVPSASSGIAYPRSSARSGSCPRMAAACAPIASRRRASRESAARASAAARALSRTWPVAAAVAAASRFRPIMAVAVRRW